MELPADPSPAAAAPASAVGCQHTGYMTLNLRGGGDVPSKKVMLYGELPPTLLKFTAKEINLGPIPLWEQQTALVQIKNAGSTDAAYRVSALANMHLQHHMHMQHGQFRPSKLSVHGVVCPRIDRILTWKILVRSADRISL